MKRVAMCLILLVLAGSVARAQEFNVRVTRFQTCENKAGAGFFWVDTTSAKTWWVDPEKMKWLYFGFPMGAASGPEGTYLAYPNKTGDGLFLLNTTTGDGWWTNGKEWKKLGRPEEWKAAERNRYER